MATWATLAQVHDITNAEDVADEDVSLAEAVIETHVGRTTDDVFRPRDLTWLKKAVAWQAAWQIYQPGYLQRSNSKEVTQDGTRVVYAHSENSPNEAFYMLAPLALRAIKNLSWMGSRSIRFRRAVPHSRDLLLGDYKRSDAHEWYPL